MRKKNFRKMCEAKQSAIGYSEIQYEHWRLQD
jgi:hypothetical protein